MIRMQTLAGLVAFRAAKLVVASFAMATLAAAIGMATAVLTANPASAQASADTCVLAGTEVDTVASAAECTALVGIYDTLDGPSWTNRGGWTTSEDPCTWVGVRCDAAGVIELDLSWNGLSGEVPAVIADLSHLQTLVLQGNDLSGSIPAAIGELSNLQFLALSDNPLSGELPSGLFNLTELRLVAIEDANLSGALPEEIGQLNKLNVLALTNNQLSGPLPRALVSLDALLVLDLSYNNFTGVVPVGLDDIEGIRQIRLDGNNFDAQPQSIGTIRNGADVAVAVSCLAGNGRIDVTINNSGLAPADYTVYVGALDGRDRTVPAEASEVVTVTGRADGPIDVIVTRDGVPNHAEQVVVDCDPEPVPPVAEVEVAVSCLASNGRVDVTLANLDGLTVNAAATGDYVVSIGELAPRPATVDAQTIGVVTATGRADGELPVVVTRAGATIHTSTVTVTCD